jgi:hypothetical protein
MKRKFIMLFNLSAALLIACNLAAQVNTPPGDPGLQERLKAVAQDKLEAQQADPGLSGESIDDYCIPGANCSYGDGFVDFAFAGISNLGSGCSSGGYGNFTSMQGSAEIGYPSTASFKTGYSDQMVSMWIDFNDDEVFSDMERILTDFNLPAANQTFSTDVTIPGFAMPGIHRMRIGANWIDPSSPDPCATFTYGEWEDYMMEITGTPISYNTGVVSIDMASVMLAGDVTPLATVANFGVETITFPVIMTSSTNGYVSTVEVVDLAVGESVQVEFDSWTVEVGAYDVEVCTDLDGDEIPDDDCQSMTIAFSDQPRQKVVAEFFTGTW